MFGRKTKQRIERLEEAVEVSMNKRLKEVEGMCERLALDEPSIALKKSVGETVALCDDVFGPSKVRLGQWYAFVGNQPIAGDITEDAGKMTPVGGYGNFYHRAVYTGYETAAKAEKAAQNYINNRRIVRIK